MHHDLALFYSDFCHTHLVQRRDDFLQACPAGEAEVDELIHIRLGLEDHGLVVPGSDVAHRLSQRNLIHIEIAFQPVGG